MASRKWVALIAVPVGLGAVVVAGLALAPQLFGGRLVKLVEQQADANLNATVRFDHADVSLLSTFPTLTVSLHDLTVTGVAPFEGLDLARIGEVRVGVDLWSAVSGGTIEIEKIALVNPDLHVVVNEDGAANYDIAKPSPADPTATASPYDIALKSVTVEKGHLLYEDAAAHRKIEIRDLDHTLSGEVSDQLLALTTRTDLASLTVVDGGVTLLRDARVGADFAVGYDQSSGKITIGDNRVAINDLNIGLSGTVEPKPDGTAVDLKFDTLDTSFKTLLSLVPTAYSGSFADVKAAGILGLNGTAKGLYASTGDHLPAFDVALAVRDANVQYPGLPSSVDAIAADVAIHHDEGAADLTVVDAKSFGFTIAGGRTEGHARVAHLVTDPSIDMKVTSNLDLAALAKAVPVENTDLAGQMDVDLDLGGTVSQFEAEAYDQVRAAGFVKASGLVVHSADYPVDFHIGALDLGFSPQQADLRALQMTFGKSDVALTGHFDNVVPYALAGHTLVGTLAITSKVLDGVPFEGSTTPDGAPPAPVEQVAQPPAEVLVAVPTDLDLVITGTIGDLITTEFEATDAKGTVRVKDGAIALDGVTMGVLGGRVGLSGTYASKTAKDADVDFQMTLADFDLRRTADAFETLGKIVPFAKAASGKFDAGFALKTRVAGDGTPDLATLMSKGKFLSHGIEVTPAAMTAIAAAVGASSLKEVTLDGTEGFYNLLNGKLSVDPMDLAIGGSKAKFGGGADVLAETLDLHLDLNLPTKGLPADVLGSVAPKGDTAKVRVDVGGTFDHPKVKASLGDAVGALVDQAKAQAAVVVDDLIAKAEAAGDALIVEANKQAAVVRADAKKAAAGVRSAAKKQGDDLVAKAKDPVSKAAAKTASEKFQKEADTKATGLEKKADKDATALVDAATKKKAALVADAKAKSAATLK